MDQHATSMVLYLGRCCFILGIALLIACVGMCLSYLLDDIADRDLDEIEFGDDDED
jgi:hypothetical protein